MNSLYENADMKTLKVTIATISKPGEQFDNTWLEGKQSNSVESKTSPSVNAKSPDFTPAVQAVQLKFCTTSDNQFLYMDSNAPRTIEDGEMIELENYRITLNLDELSEKIGLSSRDHFFKANDIEMLDNISLTEVTGNDILTSAKVEVLEDPLLFLDKGQPLSDTWYHEITHVTYSERTKHGKKVR